jgi:hypothetical protein
MPPGAELTRRARVEPEVPAGTGRSIIRASWAGAAALAVTSALAVADPSNLAAPALVVSLAMFFVGTGIFAWAYFVAIGRSREYEISVAGVFGLSESAPKRVRVQLFGSVVATTGIAIAAIAARPKSSLAFGFLAVMWALGLTGLWGARHGVFRPRSNPAGKVARGARKG